MASGLPRWPSVTITSAPASSRSSRSASCSAAAAARSGSARQPYSRHRAVSAGWGGRTRTRRSSEVIERAPNPVMGRRLAPAVDFPLGRAHDHRVSLYHEASRRWQDLFDTRRLADRIEERIVHDRIDAADRAFIEARDMFFLATADENGQPQCSYKGGDPGFVRVLDEHTVAFPAYNGNGMYLSFGNALVNPHVGLLFIDFEGRKRMRLNGAASIDDDDP